MMKSSPLPALSAVLLSLGVVAAGAAGGRPVRAERSEWRPARRVLRQVVPEPGKPAVEPGKPEVDPGKPGEEGGDPVPVDDRRPRLVIRKWAVSRALIQSRQEVTVQVTVANGGGGVIRNVRLGARPSRGLEVLEAEVPEIGFLGPDEEMSGSWVVRASHPDLYRLRVVAQDPIRELQRLEIPVAVTRMPKPPPRIAASAPRARKTGAGDFVLENKHFTAVIIKNNFGYGPMLLFPNAPHGRPREPQLAAVIAPLSRVLWTEGGGKLRMADFYPLRARIIDTQAKVHLEGSTQEGDQAWDFGCDFKIEANPWMSTQYELRAVQSANVVHFAGPVLRVGEGDAGAAQREAVFPGLEYLEGDDHSSSDETDETPAHVRLVPDPYKITIPAMGIAQEDTLVGLLWNPLQTWGGGERFPAAVFDSPNRTETQDNHRMGLFLPSVPDYVRENETLASKPYELGGNKTMLLQAKVAVLPDERDPSAVIRLWARAYGLPEHPEPPRDHVAERLLSRIPLTETLWREEVPGWNEGLPERRFPPRPYPDFVIALLMDAARTHSGAADALRDQADAVLSALDEDGSMPPRLAYRTGGVLPALLGEADAIGDLLFNQTLSGIWTWTPDPDTQNLGLHGQPPLGVVAEDALPVLRFAATTGDTQALTYGIRLLDYMDRFRVPTGGLGDDGVPLDAPDLQAATDAAECYALGYLLTQRSELLRRARFWADAGLPFIYFWRDAERPAMAFASVPTFGASRGRHPWYGIARQELGLAYGRVLRLLHDIQADPLYARVADGLLISGMYQQSTEGDFWEDPGDSGEKKEGGSDEGAGEEYDLAGLLPYSWDVFENEGRAPYLNPQRLLALMYAIEGFETRLFFGRALINSDRVFVASPNKIVRLDSTVTRIRATLHAPGDEAAFTSFSQFDQEPISIHVNGKLLDKTDQEEPLGWQWFPDRGFALVHARFTEGYNLIEVRMRQPVRSNREQRVQVPWINWPHRGGATRGWWR